MEIQVFDFMGNLRDLNYLRGKYGDFVIKPAAPGEGPAYRVSVLREKAEGYYMGLGMTDEQIEAAATLIVRLVDEKHEPIRDVRVAWYWPDAPEDGDAGPMGGVLPQMKPNRAVWGPTNENGDVGFGMGQGAYYFPEQGQIGPHAAWVYGVTTRSDLILGLGMKAGTNHWHFDVEFALVEDEIPPGECPREEVLQHVAAIEGHLSLLKVHVTTIEESVEAIRELMEV